MQHLADPKLVPEVYGPYPHAAYPAKKKSKLVTFFPSGTLQAADV